jgi:hypothetical protein
VRTDTDYGTSRKSQRLADLKHRAEELERQLSDARTSLQRELGQFGYEHAPGPGADDGFGGYPPAGAGHEPPGGLPGGGLPGGGEPGAGPAGAPGYSPGGHGGPRGLSGFQVPTGTDSYLGAGGDPGADFGTDGFGTDGTSPGGMGPRGTGPRGTGRRGTGQRGTGPRGRGTNGFTPNGFSANGFGEDGTGAHGFEPAGPDGHGFDGDGLDGDGLDGDGLDGDGFGDAASPDEERTEALVSKGRSTASGRRWTMRRVKWIAAGVAAFALLLAAVLLLTLTGGSASWPASVATVQREVGKACQNPDVKSEPGQVNVACDKNTRQILWVFALMTSANNPKFADNQTGRVGLEPITASQGGELAWSLNLHHPYDPYSPIDSLAVAARAINNIIGGATVTGTNGNPVVQPGLESDPTNCLRYTGSAAVTSRKGFPGLCAKPITSTAGQAALVADVFQKWIVGAAPQSAQDAAVLFANAKDPGDARVQAILKHLPTSKPLA